MGRVGAGDQSSEIWQSMGWDAGTGGASLGDLGLGLLCPAQWNLFFLAPRALTTGFLSHTRPLPTGSVCQVLLQPTHGRPCHTLPEATCGCVQAMVRVALQSQA